MAGINAGINKSVNIINIQRKTKTGINKHIKHIQIINKYSENMESILKSIDL